MEPRLSAADHAEGSSSVRTACEVLGRAHRFGMRFVREPRRVSRRPSGRCRRVLVVDDHPLTRAGVAALLNHEPGIRVCR